MRDGFAISTYAFWSHDALRKAVRAVVGRLKDVHHLSA